MEENPVECCWRSRLGLFVKLLIVPLRLYTMRVRVLIKKGHKEGVISVRNYAYGE